MEKKFTVADILSTSANNNVLCNLYDEVHQVDESATEAEISNGECTYDWATATVTYWHVTDEGNLEFSAELQNFDTERQKYLTLTEDLSLIRDAAQQAIRDIKSIDGPLTEDDRIKLANIRKAKVHLEYFITATNMAANKKATITPTGWLNMLAMCEPIRDIDCTIISILLADIMSIYSEVALPAIYNLDYSKSIESEEALPPLGDKSLFDLCGFVYKCTDDSYELWGVEINESDAAAIKSILSKYQNDGMTVRGDATIQLKEACK